MFNCKKEICLLKLKFINYVNNDMLKETKKALELINIIDCENLENIKKELNDIVNNLDLETEYIGAQTNDSNCIKAKLKCEDTCGKFNQSCIDICTENFKKCK